MEFETVVGLEVHLQLKTRTKIFCGCRNEFGHAPNTNVCPVCLGLPGALPVLNRRVLEFGMRVGLALNCAINTYVKFDRKNYYYPDLPKGYQISQFDFPIAQNGHLDVTTGGVVKRIGIVRAHLEEDAGKLTHDSGQGTLVDYNRTGTPLVEIVSGPDMRSAQEAYDYLTMLKLCLSYLDVSDCDMEKGSLRCDANVSVRPKGQEKLGTKTELKNLNSFSAVRRAIEHESERQVRLIMAGGAVVQSSLLWDDNKGQSSLMRTKEDAHDYRYFPEPDLVPFTLESGVVEAARQMLPELPEVRRQRFSSQYRLSEYDAGILVQSRLLAEFFEQCVALYPEPKKLANWVITSLLKELNNRRKDIGSSGLGVTNFVDLVRSVENGTISNLAGKEVLTDMVDTGRTAAEIITDRALVQVSDEGQLEKVIDEVIALNPKTVAEVLGGKTSAMGFFVGQAMRKMNGKANPKKLTEILARKFSAR